LRRARGNEPISGRLGKGGRGTDKKTTGIKEKKKKNPTEPSKTVKGGKHWSYQYTEEGRLHRKKKIIHAARKAIGEGQTTVRSWSIKGQRYDLEKGAVLWVFRG